jgi:uncharacterized membrane protein YgaE (UPF0421/DUF939 family)
VTGKRAARDVRHLVRTLTHHPLAGAHGEHTFLMILGVLVALLIIACMLSPRKGRG